MACGDRLRVERRLAGSAVAYMHHGIDVGDGTVVHARPDDFRNPLGGGRVERTSLAEFAGGGEVLVTTQPAAAYPPAEIVARAVSHVGRPGYCPVIDNCEHFATWCATGERTSRQIDILLGRIGGATARVLAAVSARRLVASAASGMAEGIAARTALGAAMGAAMGTTMRLGLRTLVPAAIVGEAAALAAEWTAHHAGRSAADSRRAGEAAGLATSAAACGLAGLPGGPGGVVAGALAGAAVWAAGGAAAEATTAGLHRCLAPADRMAQRQT